MAEKSGVGIVLDEAALPVTAAVRAAAELLGIDPLLVANEGKAVIGVRARRRPTRVLAALRAHPLGRDAAIIGDVHRTITRARSSSTPASAAVCSPSPTASCCHAYADHAAARRRPVLAPGARG